jgi:hypothetical protein
MTKISTDTKDSEAGEEHGPLSGLSGMLRAGFDLFARPVIASAGGLSEQAVQAATAALNETWRGGQKVLNFTGDLAVGSTEAVGEFFEAILTNAGKAPKALGHNADAALDQISGDPSKQQGLSEKGVRIGIGLLPVIGNTQAYGQARVRYRNALQQVDPVLREQEMHQARRNCLIASTALSLEVATLGLSGKIDLAIRVINTGLSVLNTGKAVREETEQSRFFPKIDLDFISGRADWALKSSTIRDAMDFLLRVDLKNEPQPASDSAGSDKTT